MTIKSAVLVILCSILAFTISVAQIPTDYGMPIKWDQNSNHSNYIFKGYDTLSFDSILIDKERYIRKNQANKLVEEIVFSNITTFSCGDDGIKMSGYWTKFYDSGDIKEMGQIICNKKQGQWLYFFKSGQIQKFENYEILDILDIYSNNGYLNGSYLEYHPNGEIKTIGTHRIIDQRVPYLHFDSESYETISKCCIWSPKSIKCGEWIEYDDSGNVLYSRHYALTLVDKINTRELSARFLELNINEYL